MSHINHAYHTSWETLQIHIVVEAIEEIKYGYNFQVNVLYFFLKLSLYVY